MLICNVLYFVLPASVCSSVTTRMCTQGELFERVLSATVCTCPSNATPFSYYSVVFSNARTQIKRTVKQTRTLFYTINGLELYIAIIAFDFLILYDEYNEKNFVENLIYVCLF